MRKLIFIVALLGIFNGFAQECDLCGTWTVSRRVFTNEDNTMCKTVIRINKNGARYSVRVKQIYTKDGRTETYYWHECNSISVTGNTIQWESISHTLGEEDWDNSDWINGQRIYSAKYYYVCSATVTDGVLDFRHTVRGDYYGRNGDIIGHHWDRNVKGEIVWCDYEMFKDDPDW